MEAVGFFFLWVFVVLLWAFASKSGPSNRSSRRLEKAKYERRKTNEKDLEDMLERILIEGQGTEYYGVDDEGYYYVYITWEIYGKRFGKEIKAFTLRGIEDEIRKLPKK